MKNLLKITMSLVAVMLISTAVFAGDPPTAPDQNGSVTLEVQSYLAFSLSNEALSFTYNKLTANDPAAQTTTVQVQSNIDWTASVKRTNNPLPAEITLKLNGSPMADVDVAVSKNGTMTADETFEYDFDFTGNPAPATYVTNLTYSVVAR